ncbi:hypothetical protein D7V91_07190 [bacterium 1xD42-67]|nr:hypothetical protein D7V91_07190 [bacterium 1xD42-67]
MQNGKISRTQLMALLWAGTMAPAAELLPALLLPGAGRGAWLAVVLAAPLVLAAGWLLGGLAGREGLAKRIRGLLGRRLGGGVLLIYIVWAQILLSLRSWSCARRLLASGEREGASWALLLAVMAVLLWMVRGELAAFARAGQLFLAALLATAGAVLLLSLPQAEPERLFPLWWPAAAPPIRAVLAAAGTVGWGLFTAFLLGEVADQGEREHWHWLFWGLGGVLLLAGAQAIIIGNLGAELASRLDSPFFALAKSVGVEGAFQRVEGVVAALWIFADLTMGGVLVFAVRAMAAEILPERALPWVPWGSVLLGTAGALALFSAPGRGELWTGQLVPGADLFLGLVLPGLLWIVERSRDRMGKGIISSGEEGR